MTSNGQSRGRGSGSGMVDIWRREVGDLRPRSFISRVGASENLVLRLGIHCKLKEHRGCVNTVSFNADGNILVSGSDDRMVMLWDWNMQTIKLAFHSGHVNNIFQAKIMPFTDDKKIVTCAADGEVRYAQLAEDGRVYIKKLAQHTGRVHKMVIEPGSPHTFFSCGEDGIVRQFDLRNGSARRLFRCKSNQNCSLHKPTVHLNAIAVDPRNPNIFAVAGTDELVRLYDLRKFEMNESSRQGPIDCFCPPHLLGDDEIGVTGLAFSEQSELLVSYGNELIYLFSKDQGVGPTSILSPPSSSVDADVETKNSPNKASSSFMLADTAPEPRAFAGHRNFDTMKGVGFFGPKCEYVVSGSDCGRIFIWRKKDGKLLRAMKGDKHVVNCIEPHPHAPILASSGIEHDIKIWIPNVAECAPPVNMGEVFIPDPLNPSDDYDFDPNDDDENDDDDDIDSFDDESECWEDPSIDGDHDCEDDSEDCDQASDSDDGGDSNDDMMSS